MDPSYEFPPKARQILVHVSLDINIASSHSRIICFA